MRIALLSALGDPVASAGERPAFRRFAGKSVLAHQIDCAAHLGCTRILCLAPGQGPDLAHARGYAERAGLRFDAVESLLKLASQVTADDEVILLADGLLPDAGELVTSLAERSAVLAFPDHPAIEKGFERLDATRAWSGALRARGACVARLADMPPDCDLGSTLLRTALQAGTPIVELDGQVLDAEAWQRRVDRQALAAAEWRWITRQVRPVAYVAPGLALAERVGLRWARDLGGGRWSRAPHGLAAASGVGALAAWFGGWPVAGLGLLLLAVVALTVASVFDRVEALGARPGRRLPLIELGRWMADLALVLLLSSLAMVVPSWLGSVLPLLTVGLLRLGEAIAPGRWKALYADRIVALLVLIPGSYLGWSAELTGALASVSLAGLLWTHRARRVQLTAD